MITKQEKIREGVKEIIRESVGVCDPELLPTVLAHNIKLYLHSQGVVIKVDCSECDGDGRIQKFFDRTFSNRCPKCNGYGYVATIPLVEE